MLLRILWQSSVLLALAGAAGVATYKLHSDPPSLYLVDEEVKQPFEVNVREARELAAQPGGVIWVDARQRAEYEKGHVPGALLLNQYEWEDRMMDFLQAVNDHPGRPVIIYCDAQKCQASRELRQQITEQLPVGDLDLRILHGGWPAWQEAEKR
jgi:rhodanese-related sulfurtransferase